jgi:broad specificity phosphatase PhoE
VSRLIHLVRHAEPAASWGSDPDPGLSVLGHRQATAFADGFVGPAGVWSSPMKRCQETSLPLLAKLGGQSRIVPAVSEIPTPLGLADPRAWLTDLLHARWSDQPADLCKWREGVLASLQSVDGAGPPLVVFTHFIAINAVVSALTDDPRVTCFQPGHASCTTLRLSQGALELVAKGAEMTAVLT